MRIYRAACLLAARISRHSRWIAVDPIAESRLRALAQSVHHTYRSIHSTLNVSSGKRHKGIHSVSHRFALGQSVTYVDNRIEDNKVSGRYVITQLMPFESGEYLYNVRREKTGELRRVRETQLRTLPLAPLSPSPRTGRPTTSTPRSGSVT